jgi:hypothetical protein
MELRGLDMPEWFKAKFPIDLDQLIEDNSDDGYESS